MTDGGTDGTSGGLGGGPGGGAVGIDGMGRLRFARWVWLCYAAALAMLGGVTATSFWMEAARTGRPANLLDLGIKEATSIVVVFALTWPVFTWFDRLDIARLGWPRVVLGHLAGLVAFSLTHIAAMTALRLAIYALAGMPYSFGPFWPQLLYEFRKDALVYLGMLAATAILRWALRRGPSEASAVPMPPPADAATPMTSPEPASEAGRIEIRDGARRIWLDPADILWVEAAGNYVELHTAGRNVLWRRTLAAVEEELAGHGFQRVHRSRLVNLRHVQQTANKDSGDFTITLAGGIEIAGARRWRAAFERATGK